MKVRSISPRPTKPVTKHQKVKKRPWAPKRGGVLYWLFIAVFVFLLPMLMLPVFAGVVLNVIVHPIPPLLLIATVLLSPVFCFFLARKTHQRLQLMNDDEYAHYFHQPYEEERDDSRNPDDPTSSLYWTMGPGSKKIG